jgi:hypothetical protein
MKKFSRLALVAIVANCAACASIEPLSETPQDRNLPAGRVVYVDDGSCPNGEVKRVTGGNQNKGIARETTCVPRPK